MALETGECAVGQNPKQTGNWWRFGPPRSKGLACSFRAKQTGLEAFGHHAAKKIQERAGKGQEPCFPSAKSQKCKFAAGRGTTSGILNDSLAFPCPAAGLEKLCELEARLARAPCRQGVSAWFLDKQGLWGQFHPQEDFSILQKFPVPQQNLKSVPPLLAITKINK